MKTIHKNVRVSLPASDLRPGMPYGYREIEKISHDESGLVIHDGFTTHHLPFQTLVDTTIGTALHSHELQIGDECNENGKWQVVQEDNLHRLQQRHTYLPVRQVSGETRTAWHWREQQVEAHIASAFPLWIDEEGQTRATLITPPREGIVTVLVPLSLQARDVMIGDQLNIGGQAALVTQAGQDKRGAAMHLSVLLPGYGPLHLVTNLGELLPVATLRGAS